jgi:hypothetical protein
VGIDMQASLLAILAHQLTFFQRRLNQAGLAGDLPHERASAAVIDQSLRGF